MKAISFYSIKGGTGRSLALANIATYLATKGKRVLCIDLDIQAPGLYTLFRLPEEVKANAKTVVEILLSLDELPDMRVIDGGKYLSLPAGHLFVIPAFPMNKNELLKLSKNKDIWGGEYLRVLADRFLKPLCVLKNIDYVFMDSRSGIVQEAMNAITLAAVLSPEDAMCLLFTRLDSQSRQATYHALKLFEQYQYEILTKIIVSNVPWGAKKFKLGVGECNFSEEAYNILVDFAKGITHFEKEIVVSIPFDEKYLLEHRIITTEEKDTPLYNSYRLLGEYIEKLREEKR